MKTHVDYVGQWTASIQRLNNEVTIISEKYEMSNIIVN